MAQKVNIKYSCDRKWQSLTSLETNVRHCEGCNERIRDFSKDSQPNVEGIHCGSFSLGQIGKVHSKISMTSIGTLTLSLFGLLGISAEPVFSQQPDKTSEVGQTKPTGLVKLSGIVKDKASGEPVPFAKVEFISSGKLIASAQTDFDGKFSLDGIDTAKLDLTKSLVTFSCVGYPTDTLQTESLVQALSDKDIVIDLETILNLDEVEIIEYRMTGLIGVEHGETEE
jgi:hypothetical protein